MEADAFERLDQAARQEAEHLAPMPKIEPIEAGLRGAFIAGIVIAVFGAFAGFSSDSFLFASVATVALGFFIPFGYIKYCRHLHYKAWAKKFNSLKQVQDAARS